MQINSNTYAPVVLFVYNRADHFVKTYEALSKCRDADKTDLYIFSDGPKNEKTADGVRQVREAIHGISSDTFFHSIQIIESPFNKGLANSIISGVSSVIEKYGTVIVLEDDCVASPYFLNYMNKCLKAFENDKKVGSISGYTPEISFPKDYKDDIFIAYRSCSMSWATWKDRWESVVWDSSIMPRFYKDPSLIAKFNSCGSDRFIRLYRQTRGNSSSWSVRFGANLILNDQHTVYPRYSYVKNIGLDSTGVHSKAEDADRLSVDLGRAIREPNIEKAEYVPEIQKEMKKIYSAGVVSDIKRTLGTMAIVIKERSKGRY